MMGTKHTPGPWTHQGAKAGIVEVDGFGPAIPVECLGTDTTGVAFVPSDGDPQDRANARLIAAAPEMLLALEGILEMVDEALPKFDWGRSALDANAIRLLNEKPIAVRAAIAKARGERE